MYDFERFNELVGLSDLRSREQANLELAAELAGRAVRRNTPAE